MGCKACGQVEATGEKAEEAMRTPQKINVIVHFPKTKEGWDALSKTLAELHAEFAFSRISKLQCPVAQRLEQLDAIVQRARQDAAKQKEQEDQHGRIDET